MARVRLKVKEIAQARGLSQRRLSILSGVDLRRIQRMFADPFTVVTTETLGRLTDVLDVDVSELVESVPEAQSVEGSLAVEQPGYVRGRHHSAYREELDRLKKEHDREDLEQLLMELVKAVEAEALARRSPVAPLYYEELAILYRQQRRFNDEIAILERYFHMPHTPNQRLEQRLARAQALASQE